MNNTECKHKMVISMGGSTKCTMCKSYVKFVDGKHIVVDVEDTKKTATLDSLTTKINQRLNTSIRQHSHLLTKIKEL